MLVQSSSPTSVPHSPSQGLMGTTPCSLDLWPTQFWSEPTQLLHPLVSSSPGHKHSQARVSSLPLAEHQRLVWPKCISYPKAMSFLPASPLRAALLVSSVSWTVGRGGIGCFCQHKFVSSFHLVPQWKDLSSVTQCQTFAIRL